MVAMMSRLGARQFRRSLLSRFPVSFGIEVLRSGEPTGIPDWVEQRLYDRINVVGTVDHLPFGKEQVIPVNRLRTGAEDAPNEWNTQPAHIYQTKAGLWPHVPRLAAERARAGSKINPLRRVHDSAPVRFPPA
jgi:hypothetical protein